MTRATISKDFAFSASHVVEGLPEGHQCGRLHGHNYVVRIALEGEVQPGGMVVDYGRLKPLQRYLDAAWDHRHLNDVLDFNPTAENIAVHLLEIVEAAAVEDLWPVDGISVGVSETPKTWATVSVSVARS
jgi:6-pyruvoyltetrahydropterin/6-carboxytetrahydropterin synthase